MSRTLGALTMSQRQPDLGFSLKVGCAFGGVIGLLGHPSTFLSSSGLPVYLFLDQILIG